MVVLYDSVSFDSFDTTINLLQRLIRIAFEDCLYRSENYHARVRTNWVMSIDDEDLRGQKRVFKALNSELRLRLLRRLTEGPVAAPDLAQEDEFDVTPETIVNNLNELEDVGFAEAKEVRGPGGRPRKEFTLAGDGIHLEMEVIEDEYHFSFEQVTVRR